MNSMINLIFFQQPLTTTQKLAANRSHSNFSIEDPVGFDLRVMTHHKATSHEERERLAKGFHRLSRGSRKQF